MATLFGGAAEGIPFAKAGFTGAVLAKAVSNASVDKKWSFFKNIPQR